MSNGKGKNGERERIHAYKLWCWLIYRRHELMILCLTHRLDDIDTRLLITRYWLAAAMEISFVCVGDTNKPILCVRQLFYTLSFLSNNMNIHFVHLITYVMCVSLDVHTHFFSFFCNYRIE